MILKFKLHNRYTYIKTMCYSLNITTYYNVFIYIYIDSISIDFETDIHL